MDCYLKNIAIRLANNMNDISFTPSDGWLEKFKTRNNIKFKNIHGERAAADLSNKSEFKTKFIEIAKKYKTQDIFNADKTGLFYKAVPTKSLVKDDFEYLIKKGVMKD